jgi:hypothetical protein
MRILAQVTNYLKREVPRLVIGLILFFAAAVCFFVRGALALRDELPATQACLIAMGFLLLALSVWFTFIRRDRSIKK